jgi:uncharacterized protein (DUF488 family)
MQSAKVPMNTIYTIGYSRLNFDNLIRTVEVEDLLLIDTRMSARSRVPQWNKGRLEKALGARYVHIRELGNVNFKNPEAGMVLFDPETGIQQAVQLLEKQSVLLLCGCFDVEHCHRKLVAELLADATGSPIIHWTGKDIDEWHIGNEMLGDE